MADVNHDSTVSSGTLIRARNGDGGAWASIWSRYSDRVFRQTLRIGVSVPDAEEVTVEVFRKVWSTLDNFSRAGASQSLGAWINRITQTTVLDLLKRKQSESPNLGSRAENLCQSLEKTGSGSGSAPSPVWLAFWQALGIVENECSEKAWECFQLARFAHLPHREIGLRLNMSDTNVSTTVRRVFEKIRDQSVLQLQQANFTIDADGHVVPMEHAADSEMLQPSVTVDR